MRADRDVLPHGLRAEGLELTNHYTHSSPCSPSRASLFTGQHISQHGVVDNVIMPEHKELDPAVPTIGSILRDAGYRSSYIGKWHCSQAPSENGTGAPLGDVTSETDATTARDGLAPDSRTFASRKRGAS